MKKIKAGIIGCGKFAKSQHLPNCRKADNIELWHCSSRSEKGRNTAAEYGPKKISSDYRELLSDEEVDMVILSVPHEFHSFYIKEVLKAGKNLLCEKPMTVTMEESYDTIKLVKEKNVKLCVDYNRRFSPSITDMKSSYDEIRKGVSEESRVFVQEKNRPEWAEEDQTMLMVRINDESLTYGGVHIDWKEGGGQIIGEGCHWLDLMCFLLDERPVRVSAVGSTRLNYVINVEFSEGSIGCLFFSAGGTFEYPKELIEIQSRGKLLRSECFVENHYLGRGERTIKKFPFQNDSFSELGKEGGMAGYLSKIEAMGAHYEKTGEFKYVFPDKGHQGLLESFAEAILSDTPSPVDEYTGMRATYLSLRAMESIRSGMPLPVNIEDWEMYVY